MGCTASVKTAEDRPTSTFRPIPDRFTTIAQVQQAVRKAGLESSNLILGVDFTKSNKWTGAETFGGRCLHATNGPPNPYHRVIDVIGRTLEDFDDDRLIPAFGFGDASTGDQACFPFAPDGPFTGVSAVLERYTEIAQQVALAGPTSFAPVIRQAIDIVREERGYHILVIVADGQVTDASPTGPTALSSRPVTILSPSSWLGWVTAPGMPWSITTTSCLRGDSITFSSSISIASPVEPTRTHSSLFTHLWRSRTNTSSSRIMACSPARPSVALLPYLWHLSRRHPLHHDPLAHRFVSGSSYLG